MTRAREIAIMAIWGLLCWAVIVLTVSVLVGCENPSCTDLDPPTWCDTVGGDNGDDSQGPGVPGGDIGDSPGIPNRGGDPVQDVIGDEDNGGDEGGDDSSGGSDGDPGDDDEDNSGEEVDDEHDDSTDEGDTGGSGDDTDDTDGDYPELNDDEETLPNGKCRWFKRPICIKGRWTRCVIFRRLWVKFPNVTRGQCSGTHEHQGEQEKN